MNKALETDSNRSACKWSVQVDGYCPYNEMQAMIFNSVSKVKKRCEKKECLNILLKATNSNSEAEALRKIGRHDLLKTEGPVHDAPTSNFNIEKVLHDLALASITNTSQFPNGPMYHVPFQMYDFHKPGLVANELWNLDLNVLREKKFRTFCCVLNTDKTYGAGKHWVCIFGEFRDEKWCIDYFNSSSNGLAHFKPLVLWTEHLNERGFHAKISECVDRPLQYDGHNCGVWCLVFIKSRLEGKSNKWFYEMDISDQDISRARKYIFTN
jgi:hypothetical protein